MPRSGRDSEHGMVTAETAVVLPLIAVFAMALIWVVVTVIAQIQLVDSARDGARALARGDDEQAAIGHALQAAPEGATANVSNGSDTVTVTVEVDAKAPSWLLVPLPAVHLESRAAVALEDDRG
jgi:hypothetical protein